MCSCGRNAAKLPIASAWCHRPTESEVRCGHHDPAMGLTLDSYRVRCVSISPPWWVRWRVAADDDVRLKLFEVGTLGRFAKALRRQVSVPENNFLNRVAPSEPAKMAPFHPAANTQEREKITARDSAPNPALALSPGRVDRAVVYFGADSGSVEPRWQVQQVTCIWPLKLPVLICRAIKSILRAVCFSCLSSLSNAPWT